MIIWSLTYQQNVFTRYHSDNICQPQSFYLQDGGKKTTGVDMEQNYATVTLCIAATPSLIITIASVALVHINLM